MSDILIKPKSFHFYNHKHEKRINLFITLGLSIVWYEFVSPIVSFFISTSWQSLLNPYVTTSIFAIVLYFYLQHLTEESVKKGVEWLYLTDPKIIKKRWQNKNPDWWFQSFGYEKMLAQPVYENQVITMKTEDGINNHRGAVNIKITWSAGENGDPTLYLYRNTGNMEVNLNKIKAVEDSAKFTRLHFVKNGQTMNFIDTEVAKKNNYNYYAWIEVEVAGRLVALSFQNEAYVAQTKESLGEYTDRTISNIEHKKRLEKATAPPVKLELEEVKPVKTETSAEPESKKPPTTEEITNIINKEMDEIALRINSEKDFLKIFKEKLDKLPIDDNDKEIVEANMLPGLRKKYYGKKR